MEPDIGRAVALLALSMAGHAKAVTDVLIRAGLTTDKEYLELYEQAKEDILSRSIAGRMATSCPCDNCKKTN